MGVLDADELVVLPAAIGMSGSVPGTFSVDVEDWFHILGDGCAFPVESWNGLESRVERNTTRLLEMLDVAGVRSTFFVLGWIAEKYPKLIREIGARGHEIASHGYFHQLITDQTPGQFRIDVSDAKRRLEDTLGCEVRGYRAPGFSLTSKTLWALDILLEEGYQYDSSLFPTYRGHGGLPGKRDDPHFFHTTRGGRIFEIPISLMQVGGRKWPFSGGGYLRLMPLWVTQRAIRFVSEREKKPVVIYLHPREIDPDQPRIPNLPWHRHLKYYIGLKTTESKVLTILQSLDFMTMGELYEWYTGQSTAQAN